MKKSSTSINIRFLSTAITLVLMIVFLYGTASAQVHVKNKRGADKNIGHAELKEAKVTASVVSTVEEVAPMKVRLNVLNPTEKKIVISIRNLQNDLVYNEAFQGKEYNKILNFNTTVQGFYSLHVTGPKHWEMRRFAINSKYQRVLTELDVEKIQPADVMAAIYKRDPAHVLVHIVNNSGKPVEYLIRDNERTIVHRGNVSKVQFTKVFNMTEMANGKYTIEVKSQAEKTAARTFDLKNVNERSFAWVDRRGRPLENTGYTSTKTPVTNEPTITISGQVARR